MKAKTSQRLEATLAKPQRREGLAKKINKLNKNRQGFKQQIFLLNFLTLRKALRLRGSARKS